MHWCKNSILIEHTALFKHCDLTDISDLQNKIKEIQNELGKISVVVNNAANDERHDIDSVTPEFWDNRFHVNLRHFFFHNSIYLQRYESFG